MDVSEMCSTPVYGHKNINLDITLSEIRKNNKAAQSDSALGRNGGSKAQLGSKNIQNNTESERIFDADYNSDSEYETIDVREIYCQEAERRLSSPQDFGSDNSSSKSIQLFRSPSDKNYDNYVELYLNPSEDDTQSISSDPIVSSPVFQKRFRDGPKLRAYSGPGIKKNTLLPSKISFSPKWVNGRVAAKYHSPSQIPSRSSDSIADEKSPMSAGWSSRAISYEADHLWEDFTGHMIPPSKSSSLIEETRGTVKKPGPKYSHLQVRDREYKRFTSPTRKLAPCDKENVWAHKASKTLTQIDRRNKSPDVGHLKSRNNKKVRFSLKYNATDSARQSGETFEHNTGSPVVKDCHSSETRSSLPEKSKPRVISVEIIKNPRIAKF